MLITETTRLRLEKLDLPDAPFILELLNQPEWLRFIGDRGVHNLDDARGYIRNGPQKNYDKLGYGLFKISLISSGEPLGMCGLLKRDYLDAPDIGFAFLSEHTGKGYALEAAKATLDWARETLNIKEVLAITLPENERSIALLKKLGMSFVRMVVHKPGNEQLCLYST